jgi:hypothetical protein
MGGYTLADPSAMNWDSIVPQDPNFGHFWSTPGTQNLAKILNRLYAALLGVPLGTIKTIVSLDERQVQKQNDAAR